MILFKKEESIKNAIQANFLIYQSKNALIDGVKEKEEEEEIKFHEYLDN